MKMRRCNKYLVLVWFFYAFVMQGIFATTWRKASAVDPVSGEETEVSEIMSSGGYIYKWISKYDGIFWPLTDELYIRFNPNSGYIAVGSDFEEINDIEKKKVIEFLKKNYNPENIPVSHLDKLLWLGKVYEARGADAEFFIRYYCLLSYLTRGDLERSLAYRKVALDKIESYIVDAEPSFYNAHLHVVAGFYSGLLGNKEASERYYNSIDTVDLGIKSAKKEKDSRDYLESIIDELRTEKYMKRYYPSE